MRHEQLFSQSGFYGFIVKSNALLHREATLDIAEAMQPLLSRHDRSHPFAVLDLACGGWPMAIADVMSSFPDVTFHYTGVDINPDQVAMASTVFPFPANVTKTSVIEGNAWQLDSLDLDEHYPFVFSGMNLHHGTPEEVAFVGSQIRQLLARSGRFVSHDMYRPDEAPYVPRPEMIEGAPGWMIDPTLLDGIALPEAVKNRSVATSEPYWRVDYIERMFQTLLDKGASNADAEDSVSHVRNRDYPISTRELRAIMEGLGFQVQTRRYNGSIEAMGDYVATCVMRISGG